MNPPLFRSDSNLPDAWETRLARIPLASPPPDLRAACLRAQMPHQTNDAGLGFWQSLWLAHRWAIQGLAAAWTVITALHLTTPEVSVSVADSRTVWTPETLQSLAQQRAELMASVLDGRFENPPRPDDAPVPAKTRSPALEAPSTTFPTNRMG